MEEISPSYFITPCSFSLEFTFKVFEVNNFCLKFSIMNKGFTLWYEDFTNSHGVKGVTYFFSLKPLSHSQNPVTWLTCSVLSMLHVTLLAQFWPQKPSHLFSQSSPVKPGLHVQLPSVLLHPAPF